MVYGWRTGLALSMMVALGVVSVTAGCGLPLPAVERAESDGFAFPYPTEGRPERIAIDHNTFEAEHVGHTADGGQFFLTTPFEPAGRRFVALYLFDRVGRFVRAEIDPFDKDLYQRRLKNLGKVTFDRIVVEPFEVEKFGQTFGLVVDEPTASDEIWWVTAEPGDYMAFAEPWDLGTYDT
ncbi:hypothetical protein [Actinoplanes regularis]|uniref:Uncharacterized protein n=1 Tax=Actinoplanes regularis TaxID=52697 RepID=A0A239ISF1_9ACTN|nr:hypothetical protein [Actinoplanes regularis]GIE91485.1 hypothetical protein Are01nite_79650 [Actinoplanes regularis]SNS95973.1 hypothetical protein SAMN06264365_13072 [Actinoplanes regularis]